MSFFEVIDPVFATYVLGNAPVKRLATGFDWTEGPVWFGDAGCLLFSDISQQPHCPLERGWRDHLSPAFELCERPHAGTSGSSCQLRAWNARVTRTEWDGSITVIADSYQGKRSTVRTTSSSHPTVRSGSAIRITGS